MKTMGKKKEVSYDELQQLYRESAVHSDLSYSDRPCPNWKKFELNQKQVFHDKGTKTIECSSNFWP